MRFNPLMSGYGLEVFNSVFSDTVGVLFQSSYVWIRAGRTFVPPTNAGTTSFNPLMSGYGLEGINPCSCCGKIPFQSSYVWIRAGSFKGFGSVVCANVSILLCLDTGWK